MSPASLKRGRSWLEIGVVGCSLLLWPAQAGTATRTGPSANAATPAVPSILEKNASVPPNDGLTRLFPRRLHDDANLYAAVGAWSECNPRTCTQSRPVMCETSDFKIVRDELCGDVLPEAVRACADEHGASACPSVDSVGSAENVASGPTDGSHPPSGGRESAGLPPGRSPTVSDAVDGPATSELEHRAKEAGRSRPRGSALRVGSPHASEASAGAVTTRDAGERESKAGGVLSAGSESRLSEGAAAAVPAGSQKQGVGGGKAREGEKPSANGEALGSTPVQDKSGDNYAASRSAGEPNFAAQNMERIGGRGGASDRFWTVLAVGAGAVGSFLAVAVFAFQQYRKEQHRHRGIMALNDFPQDNYINPFARHVAEEDRTAFHL